MSLGLPAVGFPAGSPLAGNHLVGVRPAMALVRLVGVRLVGVRQAMALVRLAGEYRAQDRPGVGRPGVGRPVRDRDQCAAADRMAGRCRLAGR